MQPLRGPEFTDEAGSGRRLSVQQTGTNLPRKPTSQITNLSRIVGKCKDLNRVGITSDHIQRHVYHDQPGTCGSSIHLIPPLHKSTISELAAAISASRMGAGAKPTRPAPPGLCAEVR